MNVPIDILVRLSSTLLCNAFSLFIHRAMFGFQISLRRERLAFESFAFENKTTRMHSNCSGALSPGPCAAAFRWALYKASKMQTLQALRYYNFSFAFSLTCSHTFSSPPSTFPLCVSFLFTTSVHSTHS